VRYVWEGFRLNRSEGYIASATVGLSFILIFSYVLKSTGMSSFEQLFFRLLFGLLILLAVMLITKRVRALRRKHLVFFVVIGFTYAVFALSGLSAIAFGTPIPVSVALVYTQPIFTAVISQATGKERMNLPKALLILVGVLGAFLVSGISATNPVIHLGFVFPVLAGFLYAVYLWLKRRAPVEEYTPYQVLFNTFLFAIPWLLVVWFVLRNFTEMPLFVGVTMPDSTQLFLLVLFAAFSTVLPYGLLNYVKAEEVSPTTEGLLLLGDPLLHTIWATLFLRQIVSWVQYLGAGLILVSAALNLKVRTKTTGKG
jgi:drug/metabolite transporter (DMT)-like permease